MHASHKESEDHTLFLIKANQEAWDDLVNHPLPRQMAQGTAPLNGFRHYMIVSRQILISLPTSSPQTAICNIPRILY